jgi:PAS domain S-box-containing protein
VTASKPHAEDPFAGDGEVRALCRQMDWAATPLGARDRWPAALRTAVRTILESPFPMCLLSGPELVLIYNDAYRATLGSKHPWALGRHGAVVWAEVWDGISPVILEISAGGRPFYAEDGAFDLERGAPAGYRPGSPRAWFTFSLSAVRDGAGDVLAILNVVYETTGRVVAERETELARQRAEQAEARLREVFTHAPSFLAVLRGPDHVFEYVNNAYHQLVGHRELLGRPAFEALPEVRGQGFEELLDGVMETGEAFVGREVPVLLSRTPSDEPEQRFVDFVYYPITEPDGTRSGVVAHGSDVTEHVLARRQAQLARTEAEEANRAKSQFLANMSHEIRTPLNAIVGYTDLLEMGIGGPLTEGQKTHLERVRASSEHLLMLIEDILDLSKVEAGRLELEQDRVPAVNTIAAALELVIPQATERGITIDDPCASDTNAVYVGDQDRVRQILVNLLSNAIKFTAPGGEIRITCGATHASDADVDIPEKGPLTYIRVADTGIGIAPEEMGAIFRPFTQVEGGHTRTRGGTGLGLTISRQLARLMGGDLTVESRPGAGSTFTLWLPGADTLLRPPEVAILAQPPEARPRHLAATGKALQEQIPSVLERFTERLRRDPRVPMAAGLAEADLEDHASTFLADIAQAFIVLETSEVAPERLLQDGGEIQRLVADLHGRQRAELGWTPEALRREWEILGEEIEVVVRKALPRGSEIGRALELLDRFLDRARRISRRSLAHASTPGSP